MKITTKRLSKDLIRKLSRIGGIFFDVDGVLTDGRIIYDSNGSETKEFNVRDGAIIAYLKKEGVITGIISGRESAAVGRRASELRLDFCHQGILDKGDVFEKMVKHYRLKSKQVVFIGDDIGDIPALRQAGLSVCPSDAPPYIRTYADLVTSSRGGEGVLREVGDLVLGAKGRLKF